MAKSLDVSLRNSMLDAVPTNVNYIELVNTASDGTTEIDMGVHAIAFQAVSAGSAVQDGTISFTFSLNDPEQSTNITGFRGYFGSDAGEGTTKTMEGEFTTATSINLDGTQYTINIQGITISLPASVA